MVESVEYGIVKFFNRNEDKLYGFLRVVDESGNPTGEEIFFHYYDGSNINNCDGPYFGYGFDHGGHHTVDLAMPVAGQLVVFVRTSARRGDRADQARPWGYASLWDKYLYELESAEDCERAAAVA